MRSPRVFVSYSHEDQDHDTWVLGITASLRRNGVDATLDKWDLRPGYDTTLFMESQIRDSDYVILVCTPEYARKSNIPRGGVGYEKNIISAEMLQSQDLKPKFIPILRTGDFHAALPTYLGSKYAIDFRATRDQDEALDELLRAIYEVPPPSKPPLGPNPFAATEPATRPAKEPPKITKELGHPEGDISVDGHVELWEKRAVGRFEFLRESRIDKSKGDPFARGYWQASFALQGKLRDVGLIGFLEILRASETHRSGWDIGWVPTREGIAPYPYKEGIEVWLAEEGGKGPSHSDFWRAEKIGTFSLFRGYQEDDAEFSRQFPNIQLDFSLVLCRMAEFLLYIESFASKLANGHVAANLRVRWTGLENRSLGNHNAVIPLRDRTCRQPLVESQHHIVNTSTIRESLIHDVHTITRPLFEVFNFFALSEDWVKQSIRVIFDPDRKS
jgi:hypothetical protein